MCSHGRCRVASHQFTFVMGSEGGDTFVCATLLQFRISLTQFVSSPRLGLMPSFLIQRGLRIESRMPRTRVLTDSAKVAAASERLRMRYRPARVRILFVGESPPASGRFFYQADSGLYRAVRQTFLAAFPGLKAADFLETFRKLDCYLIDLWGRPVDRLAPKQRRLACNRGETQLGATIRWFNPEVIVTVVRSIAPNVERARASARWQGTHLELPYPGRWKSHRDEFERALIPLLRRTLRMSERKSRLTSTRASRIPEKSKSPL